MIIQIIVKFAEDVSSTLLSEDLQLPIALLLVPSYVCDDMVALSRGGTSPLGLHLVDGWRLLPFSASLLTALAHPSSHTSPVVVSSALVPAMSVLRACAVDMSVPAFFVVDADAGYFQASSACNFRFFAKTA